MTPPAPGGYSPSPAPASITRSTLARAKREFWISVKGVGRSPGPCPVASPDGPPLPTHPVPELREGATSADATRAPPAPVFPQFSRFSEAACQVAVTLLVTSVAIQEALAAPSSTGDSELPGRPSGNCARGSSAPPAPSEFSCACALRPAPEAANQASEVPAP